MYDNMIRYNLGLLQYLKSNSTDKQKILVDSLKQVRTQRVDTKYIKIHKHVKDDHLKTNGFKIIRNVLSKTQCKRLQMLADKYEIHMLEFANENELFADEINDILQNDEILYLNQQLYNNPILWQKTTIHRRNKTFNLPFADIATAEHVDITETPGSSEIITCYMALTDQNTNDVSRLLLYPGTHLLDLKIPQNNIDYVSNGNIRFIKEINSIEMDDWIRESLLYMYTGNYDLNIDILKSTLTLLAYNPELLYMQPYTVNLKAGDVLFFLGNLVHGSTGHYNDKHSRVSLAIRGGFPYKEYSNLKKSDFIFYGTQKMIDKVKRDNKYTIDLDQLIKLI